LDHVVASSNLKDGLVNVAAIYQLSEHLPIAYSILFPFMGYQNISSGPLALRYDSYWSEIQQALFFELHDSVVHELTNRFLNSKPRTLKSQLLDILQATIAKLSFEFVLLTSVIFLLGCFFLIYFFVYSF